jgi:hypothetical protein
LEGGIFFKVEWYRSFAFFFSFAFFSYTTPQLTVEFAMPVCVCVRLEWETRKFPSNPKSNLERPRENGNNAENGTAERIHPADDSVDEMRGGINANLISGV